MHASLKELFLLWVFVQLEIKLANVLLFLMEERERDSKVKINKIFQSHAHYNEYIISLIMGQ